MITVSRTNKITLPRKVREKMGIKVGDRVVFVEEDGKFVLMKLDDLTDQMLESMKDFDETDREFRQGFRFREVDVNKNLF